MKKIMYSDAFSLTQAVLEGRKTMTRRIAYDGEMESPHVEFRTKNCEPSLWDGKKLIAAPRYHIGEVVAVAQSYKDCVNDVLSLAFKGKPGWTNKMFVKAEFMPVKQRCTDIKIERLQDISNSDCIKEGIICYTCNLHEFQGVCYSYIGDKNMMGSFKSGKEAFASLIDKVSGKGTWERNPWVFVYSFEIVK